MSGFKLDIDNTDWLIEQLVHSIKASYGFTTTLELETLIGA